MSSGITGNQELCKDGQEYEWKQLWTVLKLCPEAAIDRIKALPRTLSSVELESNCPLAEAVSEIF